MENSELKKQFQITLFNTQVLITTPSNNLEAFSHQIDVPCEIKIGWHDHIQTEDAALNYHECCGVLILFGITPPSFQKLYELLYK